MLSRIRNFYDNYLGVGDRLGEAFYGVWMAVVSIGLLNSVGEITPDHVVSVIGVAFAVNFVWGLIDGVTVMLTNIIQRASGVRSGSASSFGGGPASSVTLVSFQRARVFIQKMAAMTASRQSPVAFRNRFSATVARPFRPLHPPQSPALPLGRTFLRDLGVRAQ